MDAENTSTENNGLTKKELNQIWNRWYWMNEIPRTYERQVAPALMYALTPLLKKIYKDPEDLRDAYNRSGAAVPFLGLLHLWKNSGPKS